MGRASSRHSHELIMPGAAPNGGINVSLPSWQIGDNELARAKNFFYEPGTDRLRTRPGIAKWTTSQLAGGHAITGLHVLYTGAASIVMAAANNKLWYVNELAGPPITKTLAAVNIAAVQVPLVEIYPCFHNFNRNAYVAHGGHLVEWSGTGDAYLVDDVTGEEQHHPHPKVIFDMLGRLVACGDTKVGAEVHYPNRVQFSAPMNAREWSWEPGPTSDYQGVYFDLGRAKQQIVAAAIMSGEYPEILVHLRDQDKEVYRMIIQDPTAAAANWILPKFMEGYVAALNNRSAITLNNRHYFIDKSGFHGYTGSVEFDEVRSRLFGDRINAAFSPVAGHAFLAACPAYNLLFVFSGGSAEFYVFDYSAGKVGRWTTWEFKGITPRSVCYHEGIGYLLIGGADGWIYKLDPTLFKDAGSDYECVVETKRFGDGLQENLLKQEVFTHENLHEGAGTLSVVLDNAVREVQLGDLLIESPDLTIAEDSVPQVDDSNEPIAVTAYTTISRRLVIRCRNFQFKLRVLSGALRWHTLYSRIAKVGRT